MTPGIRCVVQARVVARDFLSDVSLLAQVFNNIHCVLSVIQRSLLVQLIRRFDEEEYSIFLRL